MNKERLGELWKQVEHIGTIDHFDDDRMLALGSVFGEMRSEIEKLEKENENYRNACKSWEVINRYDREQNKRYREALEAIRDNYITYGQSIGIARQALEDEN